MKRGLIFFALAASVPAMALAVPAAAPTPNRSAAAPKPVTRVPIVKRVAMSPEGNKIVQQIASVPDPRVQQIQAEVQGLLQQKAQFLTGNPVDVAKLEAVLRREEQLLSEFRTHQADRLLQIVRALSESDRIAFLQARATVVKPQGVAQPGTKPAATPPAAPAAPGR
jgi:hypothetical protein